MYYLLAAVFLIIVYLALTKILSSLIRGLLISLGLVGGIVAIYLMIKSTKEPVNVFGRYIIDNFEIIKVD